MIKRNKALAKQHALQPCFICKSTHMVSGHHLISFGSRPDLDIPSNMMSLCFQHHRQIHDIGLSRFTEIYKLHSELKRRGFEYNLVNCKWYYREKNELR